MKKKKKKQKKLAQPVTEPSSRPLVSEVNKPIYFDLDAFIKTVDSYVRSDDVLLGLNLLDSLPPYYKDFPPKEVTDYRDELMSKFVTMAGYSEFDMGERESPDSVGGSSRFPRSHFLFFITKMLNKLDYVPHITELGGGGDYWLPRDFKKHGAKLEYHPIQVNTQVRKGKEKYISNKKPKKKDIKIFSCIEVIEHMWDVRELYNNYCTFAYDSDIIFLTTPTYVFGGGMKDWRNNPHGHLRTYSPNTFMDYVKSTFSGFDFFHTVGTVQIIVGTRAKTKRSEGFRKVIELAYAEVEKIGLVLEEAQKASK